MIYQTYSSFRLGFSPSDVSDSFTFNAAARTIVCNNVTLDLLNWSKWVVGGKLLVNGTANNDGIYYIESIGGAGNRTVTLVAGSVLVNEGPIVCDITQVGADGLVTWPATRVRVTGFSDGFTGILPYSGAALEISCNSGAADAVYGVDEYSWYLSQHDDPAKKMLSVTQKPPAGGLSYSGTVFVNGTTAAVEALGDYVSGSWTLTATPAIIAVLMKYADLYCIDISRHAIQWVNLLEEMTVGY